ncbi:hypothetical protein Bca4012_074252 [Brassica carinata]
MSASVYLLIFSGHVLQIRLYGSNWKLQDGGYDAQFDQTPGRLLLRKQMKLKCYEQRIAVARTSLDQGVNAEFIRLNWNQVEGEDAQMIKRTGNVILGAPVWGMCSVTLYTFFPFSQRRSFSTKPLPDILNYSSCFQYATW